MLIFNSPKHQKIYLLILKMMVPEYQKMSMKTYLNLFTKLTKVEVKQNQVLDLVSQ